MCYVRKGIREERANNLQQTADSERIGIRESGFRIPASGFGMESRKALVQTKGIGILEI